MNLANKSGDLRGGGPRAGRTAEEIRFAAPVRYGLAILCVGVALGAGLLLQQFHFRVPVEILLLVAVAIVSWHVGRGPAVSAVILATMSCYWFFVEPIRTIYIHYSEIPFFIMFTAFAVLLCWFGTIRRRIEAGLHEQANLLSLTHDTIFVMDMEGVIKYWNRGAEERYGWTAEQAVGKVGHDLLKTVFPGPVEEIKAEVARTGRWEGEILHTKKDDTQVVVASRWALQRDARGASTAILETNNDITERKRAEEALRRSNRELRALSDCNQVLLRATDEQSLLNDICRIICEEAGYRMAWVGYAEHDEAKSVRPVAWTGAEEGYLATAGVTWADTERGRGPTGTAIRSGTSCCIQDFATDPRVAPWRESALQRGYRSGIALPLKDEHASAFGSLTIHSAQPNAFTSEEVHLLEELAADLAFGIVTLRSQAARKRAEQEVTLLSFAVDNVREAAFLLDDAGRVRYVNEEGCRALGYTRAELLGMAVPDIDPEFPAARWPEHWRDLQAHRSLSFESCHRTREGRIFPVEISANCFEYGGRAYILALVRDITERKRVEAELRDSEERFRTLVQFSFDVYWESDAQHRFTRQEFGEGLANAPAPGSEIGKTRWEVPYLEPDEAAWQQHRATMDAHRPFRDFELARPTPDGGKRYVSVSGLPMFDATGRFLGYRGVGRDITARKRAEETLRQSEAYLAEAQRLSHTGSWALDVASEKYLYMSEEFCRIFGLDVQEGLPSRADFSRHIHPEDWDRANESFEKQLREKGDLTIEYRIVLPSGTVKHVQAIRHPVLNAAGEVVQLVGTVIDMTERKRAEQERDRLRQLEADLAHLNRVSLLGELAASIAHEVGQPLAGIVSNGSACLRWLAGDPPNLERAREAASRIVRDGKRAGEVIAHIRALTRRAATPQGMLDPNQIIQDVLALVGDEATRNRVIIHTQFADDLAPVAGDLVQLQQVVLNLILNGIEAMSQVSDRARDLVITTRNVEPDRVQVTVEDSGVGLDPTTAAKIFDPFFTTKPGGMGMGLSISRSIIEAHGGRLWATAKDGPGTRFHFTLP